MQSLVQLCESARAETLGSRLLHLNSTHMAYNRLCIHGWAVFTFIICEIITFLNKQSMFTFFVYQSLKHGCAKANNKTKLSNCDSMLFDGIDLIYSVYILLTEMFYLLIVIQIIHNNEGLHNYFIQIERVIRP